MSIAIVDFTTHPETISSLGFIREYAADLLKDTVDDNNKEYSKILVSAFMGSTLKTLFTMVQDYYAPFSRDVGNAIISHFADTDFLIIGRNGVRPITSEWVRKNYPDAQYEIILTIINNHRDIVHTFIVYT